MGESPAMADTELGSVVRHIRKLVALRATEEMTEHQLLQDFLARRDDRAFAVLVKRHGPLVLALCRRVLHHQQDAEDAFPGHFLGADPQRDIHPQRGGVSQLAPRSRLSHCHESQKRRSQAAGARKFRDHLRSKTDVAMRKEVLCKILCHNICCLIMSQFELGFEPTSWNEPPAEAARPGPWSHKWWTRSPSRSGKLRSPGSAGRVWGLKPPAKEIHRLKRNSCRPDNHDYHQMHRICLRGLGWHQQQAANQDRTATPEQVENVLAWSR